MKIPLSIYFEVWIEKSLGWFPLRIVKKSTIEWYQDMQYRFCLVLCDATGHRMSKTNYTTEAMRAEMNDFLQRERDEAFQEGVEAGREPDDFDDIQYPS